MSLTDPILAALTAEDGPFPLSSDGDVRRFVRAPSDLNALIEGARRHGSATFLVEGERRLSYDDVFVLRDALAGVLDIGPGASVAICMRNRIEWMIGFLAVIRAGGVAVLVNSRGSPAELAAAAGQCEPALVLADAERAQLLRDGGYAGRILEAHDFPTGGTFDREMPAARADHAAVVLFTSGTTGRVKGAVLTHENLVTGLMLVQLSGLMIVHNMAARYGMAVEQLLSARPQTTSLLVFPLFHISGLGSGFLSPMLAGGKIVIMRRWDPEEALKLIEAERVTTLTAVPTMLWDVLHRTAHDRSPLASLSAVSSGGQALPINLLEEVERACPNAVIGTGYGLTETAGGLAMGVGDDFLRKPTSSGRLLPLAEVRLLDGEGQPLSGPDAVGEIAVRGAMVMRGYWGLPEDTAAVLSADGWFRTGDIGRIDEEGYVFIVDRKKDMVISGGENIYCAEVERVIGELATVDESAAFGLPDDRLGERLVAVVVAEGVAAGDVIAHVAAVLARYKAPTEVVVTRTSLPRNAVGKVDKILLRAEWARLAGAA